MTPTLVLLAALGPAAPVPHAVAARKARVEAEVEALRGHWKMTQYGQGPQAYDGAALNSDAEFRGAFVTFRTGGAVVTHNTFQVDPDAEPKRIDLTEIVELPAAGQPPRPRDPDRPPRRRVYRLDGDKLVITARIDGTVDEYPARVGTTPEAGLNFFVYERVPTDTAPPPRPARREP
ncbi:MAG: TIGR03067 domain-containing protein [Gemmataceae bacterium]|nr:TIGR03067 domain-containing protein [Gemmataceae bacterium]